MEANAPGVPSPTLVALQVDGALFGQRHVHYARQDLLPRRDNKGGHIPGRTLCGLGIRSTWRPRPGEPISCPQCLRAGRR